MDSKAKLKQLKIQSNKLLDTFFSGRYRSLFKGQGLEFRETRPYVMGDDIRFIDWNVSSRMNTPYCKIFQEERELVVNLMVDLSASMTNSFNDRKKEQLENIFSLIGFAAISNGDRVGSMIFTEKVEHFLAPRRNERYFLSQLKTVLSYKSKYKGSDIAKALRSTCDIMKRRGICIIISDFKADNYWQELSMLSRRNDVIAIRLEDELDKGFPDAGYVHLGDIEEGYTLNAFTSSANFRAEYAGYWETMRSNWLKNCHKRNIDTLIINSSDNALQTLITFFKHRGKH